jgi:hypothetical protein
MNWLLQLLGVTCLLTYSIGYLLFVSWASQRHSANGRAKKVPVHLMALALIPSAGALISLPFFLFF